MLRAKYPPEYFEGQNNPKKTAGEAWDLCELGVRQHRDEGKEIVLVDGQPRDIPQVGLCLESFDPDEFSIRFLLLDATLEERERRARRDRVGKDLETLAIPRLRNDMVAYYAVFVELKKRGVDFDLFDTTNPRKEPIEDLFHPLISKMVYAQ